MDAVADASGDGVCVNANDVLFLVLFGLLLFGTVVGG